MNNQDILRIAMEQSVIDFNCSIDDFIDIGNTVVISKLNEGAKKCFKKPQFCSFAYYGGGLVASVDKRIKEFISEFINRHPDYSSFDTPQLIFLNKELEKYGKCVCHIAEFFLPDIEKHVEINNNVDIKIITEDEIPLLYKDDRFHMALGYNNDTSKKDVLAVVGYIDGKIVGVAGASNDCETMCNVGIDVLPEYRRLGVATTLTKILTDEIINRGKVPFYCTAWSNIPSKNNAIKSGYRNAWVEMAAIDINDAMKLLEK
jgi:ribosomal protein S18 acetylase RimI-like enzyme